MEFILPEIFLQPVRDRYWQVLDHSAGQMSNSPTQAEEEGEESAHFFVGCGEDG